jgi:hypothetical protein
VRIVTFRLPWAQAMTVCPSLILVRPERFYDNALIAHEREHAERMRQMGTLRWWWRYLTNGRFRLREEVRAYRMQLALDPHGLERMANALSSLYLLNIGPHRAKRFLNRR